MPSTKSTPSRRSNLVRSQTTRKKIIDSAIYCLRHYGYEGTSIYTVAKKGGISKGAAQHQYPTKTDLMIAVAEHCLQAQTDFRYKLMGKVQNGSVEKWFTALADTSWHVAKKPFYVALIEIMMASRNDKALKKRFTPLNETIDKLRELAAKRITEYLGIEPNEHIDNIIQMHNTMSRGIAIGMMYTHNQKGLQAGFETLKLCQILFLEKITQQGLLKQSPQAQNQSKKIESIRAEEIA